VFDRCNALYPRKPLLQNPSVVRHLDFVLNFLDTKWKNCFLGIFTSGHCENSTEIKIWKVGIFVNATDEERNLVLNILLKHPDCILEFSGHNCLFANCVAEVSTNS
jgi:hypothetical protein